MTSSLDAEEPGLASVAGGNTGGAQPMSPLTSEEERQRRRFSHLSVGMGEVDRFLDLWMEVLPGLAGLGKRPAFDCVAGAVDIMVMAGCFSVEYNGEFIASNSTSRPAP